MGLRDDILKSRTAKPKMEAIQVFGHPLYVRKIKGAELDQYEGQRLDIRSAKDIRINYRNMRARLVVLVLCDENGERIFSDADVEAVGELPADELDAIYDVGLRLNGMDKDATERLEKNSDQEPHGGSTLSSLVNCAAPLANCSTA